MSQTDVHTDVVELCALLQCLGFTVKSLDMSDENVSQEGSSRTVVVNCQASGMHVVLESNCLSCSCPASNQQNSGFWQVSGVAGGKKLDKESGSALLGSIPQTYRERITNELRDMVRCIKEYADIDLNKSKDREVDKPAFVLDLKTPENKQQIKVKQETPTRYRSLDTLTAKKNEAPTSLPAPGLLQKHFSTDNTDDAKLDIRAMCRRQSTYTLSSTPGSVRRRNKTSSPIQTPQNAVLEGLLAAEKAAEELRCKLSSVIRDYVEDAKNDSSMSSLVLDMSKISILKTVETSKAQFASSPNLSVIGNVQDALTSRLKRFESASTSNLAPKNSPKKISKLRRLSPNFFKAKKDSIGDTVKGKIQDKTKLNSLFKPKTITPGRSAKINIDSSANNSASKKKYSHIKSTIPKATPKKE